TADGCASEWALHPDMPNRTPATIKRTRICRIRIKAIRRSQAGECYGNCERSDDQGGRTAEVDPQWVAYGRYPERTGLCCSTGPVCRDHGGVGEWQVDAAGAARRARYAEFGGCAAEWNCHQLSAGRQAGAGPRKDNRICIPVVSTDSDVD